MEPYLAEARDLKAKVAGIRRPGRLTKTRGIRGALSIAAGIKSTSPAHCEATNEDAIRRMIRIDLAGAGQAVGEGLICRFLLTRGDSLGGSMRNVGGVLAQRKFARAIIASLTNAGVSFRWLHRPTNRWADVPADGSEGIEFELRGLTWGTPRQARTVFFNLKVPPVQNSVDVCLLNCCPDDHQAEAIANPARYLALGELKGGIDPAGADEHWKTAGTALARIRDSFRKQNLNPPIFYVGGAIAEKMADEIWEQLKDGRLANAANLTCDEQVASLCRWLCEL